MLSSTDMANLFFSELKKFNSTNFKTLEKADLSIEDATVHKAFSSVVTRYFIFREKHPELSEVEHRILYFKLKLDLISRYFSEYPDTNPSLLQAFQLELQKYVKDSQKEQKGDESDENSASVQSC